MGRSSNAEVFELLKRDFADERADLLGYLNALTTDDWLHPTLCEPWTIRDQVIHLGWFDHVATLAVENPSVFAVHRSQGLANPAAYEAEYLHRFSIEPGPSLVRWWTDAGEALAAALTLCDESLRVPWFDPEMSIRSMVSGRLMEHWAHGQDIVDALNLNRDPTDRLRHVAMVAVRARPYAYVVRGLTPPTEPIRVELAAPSGAAWLFDPTGQQSVRGSAFDFCLVLNRRRNIADTTLAVDGLLAEEWMEIGQAFAGPPGPGRKPGQTYRSKSC